MTQHKGNLLLLEKAGKKGLTLTVVGRMEEEDNAKELIAYIEECGQQRILLDRLYSYVEGEDDPTILSDVREQFYETN